MLGEKLYSNCLGFIGLAVGRLYEESITEVCAQIECYFFSEFFFFFFFFMLTETPSFLRYSVEST